jgi:hypothetical protein
MGLLFAVTLVSNVSLHSASPTRFYTVTASSIDIGRERPDKYGS